MAKHKLSLASFSGDKPMNSWPPHRSALQGRIALSLWWGQSISRLDKACQGDLGRGQSMSSLDMVCQELAKQSGVRAKHVDSRSRHGKAWLGMSDQGWDVARSWEESSSFVEAWQARGKGLPTWLRHDKHVARVFELGRGVASSLQESLSLVLAWQARGKGLQTWSRRGKLIATWFGARARAWQSLTRHIKSWHDDPAWG